mmetsp:Transcript_6088/g.13802  ORF Transcript_6088/g.13802 Transcript_6088/m.13802 type:complete len:384 (+) Transcript_6088:194-1345(+)
MSSSPPPKPPPIPPIDPPIPPGIPPIPGIPPPPMTLPINFCMKGPTSGSAIISCIFAGLLMRPIGPPGPDMSDWNAAITFGFCMPAAISGSDIRPAIIPSIPAGIPPPPIPGIPPPPIPPIPPIPPGIPPGMLPPKPPPPLGPLLPFSLSSSSASFLASSCAFLISAALFLNFSSSSFFFFTFNASISAHFFVVSFNITAASPSKSMDCAALKSLSASGYRSVFTWHSPRIRRALAESGFFFNASSQSRMAAVYSFCLKRQWARLASSRAEGSAARMASVYFSMASSKLPEDLRSEPAILASAALSKSSFDPSPAYIGGNFSSSAVASTEDSVPQLPPKGQAFGSALLAFSMAFFFHAGISFSLEWSCLCSCSCSCSCSCLCS